MRTLNFYGYSDDLVEVDGTDRSMGEPDEFDPYEKPAAMTVIDDEGTGLVVVVHLVGQTGTWSVGIAPLDEGHPLPDWPMRWAIRSDCVHSAELQIDAPDSARVAIIEPSEVDGTG